MRYYLSSCEYKWTHSKLELEQMWVMRELGQELWEQVNQDGFDLVLLRSNSQTLPSDIYCRCDIYVDVDDTKHGTLFALKYPQAKPVHKVTE